MDKSWKVILAFTGVFLAGVLGGTLLGVRFGRHFFPSSNRSSLSQNFGPQMMRRLGEQLDLTPEQKAQISPIVDKAQGEVQRLRRDHVKEITKVMDQMHSEVSAVLTPEQRTKLQELRQKFRERSERLRRENRGGDRDRDRPPPPN